MTSAAVSRQFRTYHRYLGFFLAGIMAVYALSGSLLIFRKTDFLKYEQVQEKQLEPNLTVAELAPALKLRKVVVVSQEGDVMTLSNGEYNIRTGLASVTVEDYPWPLNKMVKLHKATTKSPAFFLNLFFGFSLLFFSISSFFMFISSAPAYRTGLKVAGAGFILAVVLLML